MVQLLTIASTLALAGLLGWPLADQWLRRHHPAHGVHTDQTPERTARPIYKASAQEFLRGAADLTFGALILGLGFFMLMWVIATG